ncbi:MAG: HEAT repeat domain-containing protein [Chloroflexi bacterium]|nr:HEAT repeat domain-containing protein [Chloroflexota bacterium]
MERPDVLPFAKLAMEVLDDARPLRDSALSDISDLDLDELEVLRQGWVKTSVARRRGIITRMSELSEDNFDLNFDRVFLMALRDPDATVRARAATGLSQCEEASVTGPLLRVLADDGVEEVRVAAAQALGRCVVLAELDKVSQRSVEKVRDALLAVVEDRHASIELRRHALEALSPWTSPRVTALIEDAYHSGDDDFRASALHAMGMNCDPRWLPTLLAELSSKEARFRHEAARSCGEIAQPEAVPYLLPLLQDEDIEVRMAAIWASVQIGGKEATRALRALLADEDERVRDASEEALREIAAGEGLGPPFR